MGVFILCVDLVLKWFALVARTSVVGLSYSSGSLALLEKVKVTEDRANLLLWLQTPGAAKCHVLGFVTVPVTSSFIFTLSQLHSLLVSTWSLKTTVFETSLP